MSLNWRLFLVTAVFLHSVFIHETKAQPAKHPKLKLLYGILQCDDKNTPPCSLIVNPHSLSEQKYLLKGPKGENLNYSWMHGSYVRVKALPEKPNQVRALAVIPDLPPMIGFPHEH